ncbi:hypothetical protein [Streptomyces sp. NPDC007205]
MLDRLTDGGVAALDAEAERTAAGAGAAVRPAAEGPAGSEPPTAPGLA